MIARASLALALVLSVPSAVHALDASPWDRVLRAHARGGGFDYAGLARDAGARADLRLFLEGVAAMLEVGGFAVLPSSCGADALRRLEEQGPIALLVTETALQDMSGGELSRRVGQSHPETKLLYLSGYAEEPWLRAQNSPFLSLPLSAEGFLTGVRHALASPSSMLRRVR